jgi:hypothetical protein
LWYAARANRAHELGAFLDESCLFGLQTDHESCYIVQENYGVTTGERNIVSFITTKIRGSKENFSSPLITESNELCGFVRFVGKDDWILVCDNASEMT